MIPNEGDVLLAYMAWRQWKARRQLEDKRGPFMTLIALEYGYGESQRKNIYSVRPKAFALSLAFKNLKIFHYLACTIH